MMKKLIGLLVAAILLAAPSIQDEGISRDEFELRRKKVIEGCDGGVAVIKAGVLTKDKSDDQNAHKFDFRYLTGAQLDGAILVLLPTEPGAVLFVAGNPKETGEATGLEHVRSKKEFSAFWKEVLSASPAIYVKSKKDFPSAEKVKTGLKAVLSLLRLQKSEAEITCSIKAADATSKAHVEAMKRCTPGMSEGELQKIIEETFTRHGATDIAFGSIVGSGANGTVLHYRKNNQEMKDGSLVVMDIGAEYHGYAADITRTIPVNGVFTKEQRIAYQCVLDAQAAAEKILKPGVTWRQLHQAAAAVFKKRGMTDWSYAHSKEWSVRHGLGHYLGLHVHDVGDYKIPLKEGMILTIEPGYYNKDKGFGIRIEDSYVLTQDGYRRISKHSPRDIDEIEK